MTSKEKADLIVGYADELKAERIETLSVRDKTSITDYFVVCTGNSDTHMNAIAEKVREKMSEHKVKPLRSDQSGGGWVLHDYGDVVFHVMREEKRQFYDLETLWGSIQADPNLLE
ncbi:MAG TPA: ribosome silencing factor [Fimbriimonadaceae bacterium]|nr:ribosome silencing factor [Fimbriimonadaceae bacterium]HRJ95372.1 ribosome silencing factor [Fimbriimonadaceae bacterium]